MAGYAKQILDVPSLWVIVEEEEVGSFGGLDGRNHGLPGCIENAVSEGTPLTLQLIRMVTVLTLEIYDLLSRASFSKAVLLKVQAVQVLTSPAFCDCPCRLGGIPVGTTEVWVESEIHAGLSSPVDLDLFPCGGIQRDDRRVLKVSGHRERRNPGD